METNDGRSVYFDNIRNIMVFNVVFAHIMIMFTYPLAFAWPVIDKKGSSMIYKTLFLIMDIYVIPVLIFIAALFIFPSLNARSVPEYIKKRFQRLFIPVIVFTFCAGDIYHQILLKRLGGSSPDYIQTFLDYWRDFLHFSVITIIGEGKMLNQVSFNLHHTWFLSLLFFMLLMIALLSLPFRKKKKKRIEIDTRKKIIFKTIIFAMISGFFYILIMILYSVNGLDFISVARVCGLIQVRNDQIWQILLLFFFGLYIYRKEWLTRGDIGNWKIWGALSFVFLFIFVIMLYNWFLPVAEEFTKVLEHNMTVIDKIPFPVVPDSLQLVFAITNIMLLPVTVFLLMFFLSFAKKFMDRPNKVTAFCTKHSINVYLLHFIPVILLQYIFKNLPVPPIVKIIAIMIIVIPACLWLSYRLVSPYPAIAISFFVVLKLVSLYVGFGFYYKALLAILFISFTGAMFETGRQVVTGRIKEWNLVPRGDAMK